jgi:hypothetical protein
MVQDEQAEVVRLLESSSTHGGAAVERIGVVTSRR